MLVMKRWVGERIYVKAGDSVVVITLCEVTGKNTARIGIEAPRHWMIAREELLTDEQYDELEGRRLAVASTHNTRPSPAHREDKAP